MDKSIKYEDIKKIKDAIGEPGFSELRIFENEFLDDNVVIVSSKMYKALQECKRDDSKD